MATQSQKTRKEYCFSRLLKTVFCNTQKSISFFYILIVFSILPPVSAILLLIVTGIVDGKAFILSNQAYSSSNALIPFNAFLALLMWEISGSLYIISLRPLRELGITNPLVQVTLWLVITYGVLALGTNWQSIPFADRVEAILLILLITFCLTMLQKLLP